MGLRQPPRRVGVLGGTFDPVHNGHLRTALEIRERLALDELHLVPVHTPALRAQPGASAAQRSAMLSIAVEGSRHLLVDERELRRGGVSYTIDTVRELRAELGEHASLFVVVGEDAYAGFERWKEWQRLLDYAHVVVLTRPGDSPSPGAALCAWTAQHLAADPAAALEAECRGRVLRIALTQLAISSTSVRELVAAGRSPRFLLPDGVLEYIRRNRIYAGAAGQGESD